MALVPVISLSLGNKCNKVTLREETGFYEVINNPTGWGIPNIETGNITNSIVNILNHEGTTILDSYNLTDLYSVATPSPFNILTEVPWLQVDGIFQIRYQVTDNSGTPVVYFSETTHELFICNLCNCKDSLITKLVKSCDAIKTKELKIQVDQIEIFIYGIQTAFSCGDFVTANTILTAASTYCQTVSNCGCGC